MNIFESVYCNPFYRSRVMTILNQLSFSLSQWSVSHPFYQQCCETTTLCKLGFKYPNSPQLFFFPLRKKTYFFTFRFSSLWIVSKQMEKSHQLVFRLFILLNFCNHLTFFSISLNDGEIFVFLSQISSSFCNLASAFKFSP